MKNFCACVLLLIYADVLCVGFSEERFLNTLEKSHTTCQLTSAAIGACWGLMTKLLLRDKASVGLATAIMAWASVSKVVSAVLFAVAMIHRRSAVKHCDRKRYEQFARKQVGMFYVAMVATFWSALYLMAYDGYLLRA